MENPPENCPVHSPEFIKQLYDLEMHKKEHAELIKKLSDSHEKHEMEMEEIREMFKDVIGALNGVMGRSGLVQEHADQEYRIHALEDWKRDIKSFTAGALAVCSIVSAGLTLSLKYVIEMFRG